MKRIFLVLLFVALLGSLLAVPTLVIHASSPAGTWALTGSMNEARQNQTATLLNNGDVLVTPTDCATSGIIQTVSPLCYTERSGKPAEHMER